MTFLPIVDRELRVAARRKGTYRIRCWTAVVAIVAVWFSLGIASFGRGTGIGSAAFTFVSGYAFGLCLLAGVLLTADSLSQEKREGTLGLLFLTDLKGYDVVLGKFLAVGLNAFYGLLAIIPMMGLALLYGGVTGGQFWRTALALMNALFFSLAAGMFVSAQRKDLQSAMVGTVVLLFLLVVGLPAGAQLVSYADKSGLWSIVGWVSPYYPFSFASSSVRAGQDQFWRALLLSNFCGWCLLGLSSWLLPRRWQDAGKPVTAGRRLFPTIQSSRKKNPLNREELGRQLDVNPVLGLIQTQPQGRRYAWIIVTIWCAVAILALIASTEMAWMIFQFQMPFGFLIKCLVAAQACRFFAEARTNGALEMLLSTPLTNAEIIGGQRLALRRNFLAPIVVMAVFMLLPGVVALCRSALAGDRNFTGSAFGVIGAAFYVLRLLLDSYTVGSVGMAFALKLQKPSLALAYTILFVLILPSVFIGCWLDILVDLIFLAWASSWLKRDFRALLLPHFVSPAYAVPPVYPSAMSKPPLYPT